MDTFKKSLLYVASFTLALIAYGVLFDCLLQTLNNYFNLNLYIQSNLRNRGIIYQIIFGCLIGPLIETYLFQDFIYKKLIKSNLSNNKIILISSLIFSASHFYSIAYIIFSFFSGVILMLGYLNWKELKPSKLFITYAIHLSFNLFVCIANYFL